MKSQKRELTAGEVARKKAIFFGKKEVREINDQFATDPRERRRMDFDSYEARLNIEDGFEQLCDMAIN